MLASTQALPGTASVSWKRELRENERAVRDWAFSLNADEHADLAQPETNPLGGELAKMADLERQALGETPKAKLKTSVAIERGPIGKAVKKANGYKCQICMAQGANPLSFLKKNGIPYVEAHHVTPVSELQIGSLAASNIMTLCANHHKQMHYGDVSVEICENTFEVQLDGESLTLKRHSFL
ncbi:HNH endonuclease [Hoeflea sp.]|uniref:HNH endonuclease n=1 Tax=Hoeflea sp. TaxID=1940281 RepID=UPI003A8E4840